MENYAYDIVQALSFLIKKKKKIVRNNDEIAKVIARNEKEILKEGKNITSREQSTIYCEEHPMGEGTKTRLARKSNYRCSNKLR